MGDAVLLELLFDGFDLAVVNKEVAPRRASRVCRIFLATRADGCWFRFGAFLHGWARWFFWLRKVGALWKRGAFKWLKALGFVGCRWRTRAILLHKLSSTLCLLGWSSSPGMKVPNLLRHCSYSHSIDVSPVEIKLANRLKSAELTRTAYSPL